MGKPPGCAATSDSSSADSDARCANALHTKAFSLCFLNGLLPEWTHKVQQLGEVEVPGGVTESYDNKMRDNGQKRGRRMKAVQAEKL